MARLCSLSVQCPLTGFKCNGDLLLAGIYTGGSQALSNIFYTFESLTCSHHIMGLHLHYCMNHSLIRFIHPCIHTHTQTYPILLTVSLKKN